MPENKKEGWATDREVADFFTIHIDNPCETELYDGQIVNIRDFYIREAEKLLPTFTNIEAQKIWIGYGSEIR